MSVRDVEVGDCNKSSAIREWICIKGRRGGLRVYESKSTWRSNKTRTTAIGEAAEKTL